MNDKSKTLEIDVKKAEVGRESSESRTKLMSDIDAEKERAEKLKARLQEFADNDPAALEDMAKEAATALEAANRWTDNIFSIQSWIRKKFPSIDQVSIPKL